MALALGSLIAGVGSALSSVASPLVSLAGTYLNYKSQKQSNEQNQANFDQNFAYQQYLNENQYQIQSADASKAGINPIALHGGTLTSFSGSANQQGSDFSALSSALTPLLQYKLGLKQIEAQKSIAELQSSTQKDINTENISATSSENALNRQSNEYIAKINNDNAMQLKKLDVDNQRVLARESNALAKTLQECKNASDLKIALENRETQRQITSLQDTLKRLSYLEFETINGKSLPQALYELQKQSTDFNTSKGQRAFNNALSIVNTLNNIFGNVAGFMK